MRPLFANNANPSYRTGIYPILKSFADEVCNTLASLIAYVGTLALFGMLSIHLWNQLPALLAAEPAAPKFAGSQLDIPDKTEAYAIFRHPENPAAAASASVDWVTSAENPHLRGAF